MSTTKQEHALVSYFVKAYEGHYGFKPVVNRYKAQWGVRSILMEMSVEETESLIDYYFETVSQNSHDLDWFFYNYDKLINAKHKRDTDATELARLREQSKKRVEEWRAKHGNN